VVSADSVVLEEVLAEDLVVLAEAEVVAVVLAGSGERIARCLR